MKPVNAKLRNAVRIALDALFERTKARLLGRYYKGPHAYFQIVRDYGLEDTVEGVFRHTMLHEIGQTGDVNSEIVDAQSDEVSVLLDALKARTTVQVMDAVKHGNSDIIGEIFDKATSHLETIADNELARTQNLAASDSISQIAASAGIEDPTVFAIGRLDAKTCKFCRTMFHCKSNEIVPRVFKLSQIADHYLKPKLWDGKTIHRPPVHPNCRDRLTILMPNFGFDASGGVQYMGMNHDEYELQRARGDTY